MQRKNAILRAANHHFGRHGFRGASLRDIARDAEVSLTLLNHHFGSKFQLLGAVIDSHREMLDERASAVQKLMADSAGRFTIDELVQVWIRIGFDTAADVDGEQFLRLMARVMDDPSEEAAEVVRDKLDDAALVFIDALQQCYPGASRYAAASTYLYVSAALVKFLVGSKRLFRLVQAHRPDGLALDGAAHNGAAHNGTAHNGAALDGATADAVTRADEARLTRFLVAGIDAALRTPERAPR